MKVLLSFVLMVMSIVAQADGEVIHFANKDQEYRYKLLTKELRCAKCQNQNLADSHAELAHDLRSIVLEMIESGKTNHEIKEYMVARYGNFILYRPPVDKNTMFLWFAPLGLLLFALWFIIRTVKLRQEQVKIDKMSDDEQQKLTALMQENNQKDVQ